MRRGASPAGSAYMNTMPLRTTGDPLADQRFALAQSYAGDGEWEIAADLMAQALERAPDFAPGHVERGTILEKAGDITAAALAYETALSLDAKDVAGAGLRLARLRGLTPSGAPPAHVEALFDGYAERFESHLVGALAYCAPDLIAAAIRAAAPGRRFARALDLGCGTGLMADALPVEVVDLAGVDLSGRMISLARARNRYSELDAGDMVPWLNRQSGADLVLAADVLVYVGALEPVFAAVAGALLPGGLFAFTVQSGPSSGYRLGDDLRFGHSERYLRTCAKAHGLEVVSLDAAVTRHDAGRPVPGLLAVLRKGAPEPMANA